MHCGEKWGTVPHVQRPLLVGEYDFTLDAKNRIAIPARLRSAYADGIYLTTWHEHSLAGFDPEKFEEHLNAGGGTEETLSSKRRANLRFISAGAVWLELDGQGRVTLPARLIEYACMGREATIIGVGDHVEIWDRAAWAAYRKTMEEGADATADELAAS